MSDIEKQLERIFSGVNRLMSLHEEANAEIAKLKAENAELVRKVSECERESAELSKKMLTGTIANKVADSDFDKKQMKLKINELVREVDKCISLLNQ